MSSFGVWVEGPGEVGSRVTVSSTSEGLRTGIMEEWGFGLERVNFGLVGFSGWFVACDKLTRRRLSLAVHSSVWYWNNLEGERWHSTSQEVGSFSMSFPQPDIEASDTSAGQFDGR